MDWFDIIKIKTKPVDRDRPAPKIDIDPREGGNANYSWRDDSISIKPDTNMTPERLANLLAHETTHQAQHNTEPELVRIASLVSQNFIKLFVDINSAPDDLLTHEDFMSLFIELQPELERNLKLYFETMLTIEIQAYSTSKNLDDIQYRIQLVNTMINDIIERSKGIAKALNMSEEKYAYTQSILTHVLRPLIDRVAASFVRREKVEQ